TETPHTAQRSPLKRSSDSRYLEDTISLQHNLSCSITNQQHQPSAMWQCPLPSTLPIQSVDRGIPMNL
ncbi:MAG: hypothetical protein ACK5PZ_11575, partial [Pirellula sp.]